MKPVCGIAGIAGLSLSDEERRELVEGMNRGLAHRGPDDEGVVVMPDAVLGMRRLSIIDLAGGHQPIANEDESAWVVANGEVYNYRELRRVLERCGHRFRTASDTEVVLHAYEEFEGSFPERLRGMYGAAVWDCNAQRLTLVLDRFGIKPLYYAALESGIVFASELGPLMSTGLADDKLDAEALAQYFALGYIPAPATVFATVRKIEPGWALTWTRRSGVTLRRYWDLPRADEGDHRPMADVRAQMRRALTDAVRSHLVSDVPVGAFLSGGIDSSTVVALMSEVSDEPVRTFSIGFADPRHNELDLARLVARRFGTMHHELVVEPTSVDVLPGLASHFGEPFGDSSALPTYIVSQMAREHVKVVLSGDGGDELFLGYTVFRGLEVARHAQRIPRRLRLALDDVAARLPVSWVAGAPDRLETWRKRFRDSLMPPLDAYLSKSTPTGLAGVRGLLTADLRRVMAAGDPYAPLVEPLCERAEGGGDPLEAFAYTEVKVGMNGDILVKVDRMSMAHSLEVRVPLLDHVLAEEISRLPIRKRFPRWRLKGLLKDTMSDVLPAEVLRAPKHGFTAPIAAWFRGDVNQFVLETLVSPESRAAGFFDCDAVEAYVKSHRDSHVDAGAALWALLMFELWRKECAVDVARLG